MNKPKVHAAIKSLLHLTNNPSILLDVTLNDFGSRVEAFAGW